MHQLQKQIDVMTKMFAETRAKYHLTLGELVTVLKLAPKDFNVRVDIGGSLGSPYSYRGYYEDLAFESYIENKSVETFLAEAEPCLNKLFEGYKGGKFLMDIHTPLWISYYGESSDVAMISIKLDREKEAVVIITKIIELKWIEKK